MNDDKFWSRVSVKSPDECWEWQGHCFKDGYGCFERHTRAHRHAWFLKHGYQSKLWILHKCDNRKCVNPSHLWEGTAKDNTQDMLVKGRANMFGGQPHDSFYGERCGKAKLRDADVITIRKRCALGEKDDVVAKDFNVSKSTINHIRLRRRWKHLP